MSKTIHHHPESDLLLAYATGATDAAVSLILATHLTFCPACRRDLASAEEAGGALLDALAPTPMAPDAFGNVLARLDTPQHKPEPGKPAASRDHTPAPLRAWLGRDLGAVRWRKIGPRLAYVPLYARGPVRMRLLRGAPGADVGRHDHRGLEFTLVLAGGYSDQTGSFGPGDFQTAAPDFKHNPLADPGEDCINLAVTTAPLRFDGLIQKAAAKIFGF